MGLLPFISPEEGNEHAKEDPQTALLTIVHSCHFHMTFDQNYFHTHTYKDVTFKRFSQYWWSNRFYAILARRHGRKAGRLLEIGSGMGHLVGQLEPDFETSGLDVNPWALQESKKVTRATFLVAASAEGLPFQDDWFDVVIIKHVIEHLKHPTRAIGEISRVTRSGGLLVFSTPNPDSMGRGWKKDQWIGYRDPTHISIKKPKEWLELLKAAGYKIRKCFSDGLWDAPYILAVPRSLQKVAFGSLGGLQAILGLPFLPVPWGESIILLAHKTVPGNSSGSHV